eukprot:jgi/Botrbrau1/20010/Bobra.200_1s0016.1
MPAAVSCPICYEQADANENKKWSLWGECGHVFHTECIHASVSRSMTRCPLCKKEFAKKGRENTPRYPVYLSLEPIWEHGSQNVQELLKKLLAKSKEVDAANQQLALEREVKEAVEVKYAQALERLQSEKTKTANLEKSVESLKASQKASDERVSSLTDQLKKTQNSWKQEVSKLNTEKKEILERNVLVERRFNFDCDVWDPNRKYPRLPVSKGKREGIMEEDLKFVKGHHRALLERYKDLQGRHEKLGKVNRRLKKEAEEAKEEVLARDRQIASIQAERDAYARGCGKALGKKSKQRAQQPVEAAPKKLPAVNWETPPEESLFRYAGGSRDLTRNAVEAALEDISVLDALEEPLDLVANDANDPVIMLASHPINSIREERVDSASAPLFDREARVDSASALLFNREVRVDSASAPLFNREVRVDSTCARLPNREGCGDSTSARLLNRVGRVDSASARLCSREEHADSASARLHVGTSAGPGGPHPKGTNSEQTSNPACRASPGSRRGAARTSGGENETPSHRSQGPAFVRGPCGDVGAVLADRTNVLPGVGIPLSNDAKLAARGGPPNPAAFGPKGTAEAPSVRPLTSHGGALEPLDSVEGPDSGSRHLERRRECAELHAEGGDVAPGDGGWATGTPRRGSCASPGTHEVYNARETIPPAPYRALVSAADVAAHVGHSPRDPRADFLEGAEAAVPCLPAPSVAWSLAVPWQRAKGRPDLQAQSAAAVEQSRSLYRILQHDPYATQPEPMLLQRLDRAASASPASSTARGSCGEQHAGPLLELSSAQRKPDVRGWAAVHAGGGASAVHAGGGASAVHAGGGASAGTAHIHWRHEDPAHSKDDSITTRVCQQVHTLTCCEEHSRGPSSIRGPGCPRNELHRLTFPDQTLQAQAVTGSLSEPATGVPDRGAIRPHSLYPSGRMQPTAPGQTGGEARLQLPQTGTRDPGACAGGGPANPPSGRRKSLRERVIGGILAAGPRLESGAPRGSANPGPPFLDDPCFDRRHPSPAYHSNSPPRAGLPPPPASMERVGDGSQPLHPVGDRPAPACCVREETECVFGGDLQAGPCSGAKRSPRTADLQRLLSTPPAKRLRPLPLQHPPLDRTHPGRAAPAPAASQGPAGLLWVNGQYIACATSPPGAQASRGAAAGSAPQPSLQPAPVLESAPQPPLPDVPCSVDFVPDTFAVDLSPRSPAEPSHRGHQPQCPFNLDPYREALAVSRPSAAVPPAAVPLDHRPFPDATELRHRSPAPPPHGATHHHQSPGGSPAAMPAKALYRASPGEQLEASGGQPPCAGVPNRPGPCATAWEAVRIVPHPHAVPHGNTIPDSCAGASPQGMPSLHSGPGPAGGTARAVQRHQSPALYGRPAPGDAQSGRMQLPPGLGDSWHAALPSTVPDGQFGARTQESVAGGEPHPRPRPGREASEDAWGSDENARLDEIILEQGEPLEDSDEDEDEDESDSNGSSGPSFEAQHPAGSVPQGRAGRGSGSSWHAADAGWDDHTQAPPRGSGAGLRPEPSFIRQGAQNRPPEMGKFVRQGPDGKGGTTTTFLRRYQGRPNPGQQTCISGLTGPDPLQRHPSQSLAGRGRSRPRASTHAGNRTITHFFSRAS